MCLLVPCSQKQSTRRKGRLAPARPPPVTPSQRLPGNIWPKVGLNIHRAPGFHAGEEQRNCSWRRGKGRFLKEKLLPGPQGLLLFLFTMGNQLRCLPLLGSMLGEKCPLGAGSPAHLQPLQAAHLRTTPWRGCRGLPEPGSPPSSILYYLGSSPGLRGSRV